MLLEDLPISVGLYNQLKRAALPPLHVCRTWTLHDWLLYTNLDADIAYECLCILQTSVNFE